jgi:hypothetical protein
MNDNAQKRRTRAPSLSVAAIRQSPSAVCSIRVILIAPVITSCVPWKPER